MMDIYQALGMLEDIQKMRNQILEYVSSSVLKRRYDMTDVSPALKMLEDTQKMANQIKKYASSDVPVREYEMILTAMLLAKDKKEDKVWGTKVLITAFSLDLKTARKLWELGEFLEKD